MREGVSQEVDYSKEKEQRKYKICQLFEDQKGWKGGQELQKMKIWY